MANPVKGEVEAGEYTLVFDINTMCELEAEFDTDTNGVLQLLAEQQRAPRMTVLRKFFRAALAEHHPEMDDRAAGKAMTAIGTTALVEALAKGAEQALPEAFDEEGDGDGEENPPPSRKAG